MKYFGDCIVNIQLLPLFIRYGVTNNIEDEIIKSTNFFSDLYCSYKNRNLDSLISPKLSGVDFSKIKELDKLTKKKEKYEWNSRFYYQKKIISKKTK